jgi:hypothetical protein
MNNLTRPYKTGVLTLFAAALMTGCATHGEVSQAFLENAHRINALENRNQQLFAIMKQQNGQLAAAHEQLQALRSQILLNESQNEMTAEKVETLRDGITLHAGEEMALTPIIFSESSNANIDPKR